MKNNNYLLDSYCQVGSDLASFSELAKELDTNTSLLPFTTDNLEILSYINRKNEAIQLLMLGVGQWNSLEDITSGAKVKKIPINRFEKNEELMQELMNETKTIWYFNSDETKGAFLFSSLLYKTLSGRQSGVGNELLRTPDIKRNIALAHQFYLKPLDGMLLVRKRGLCKKIFSIYSEKYERVAFSDLARLAESVEGIRQVTWKITNKELYLYMEYPKNKKGYCLGIRLYTSDTSFSPTGIQVTCRKSNCKEYFVLKSWDLNHMHNSVISFENLQNNLNEALNYLQNFSNSFLELIQNLDNILVKTEEEYTEIYKKYIENSNLKAMIGNKNYTSLINNIFAQKNITKRDVFEDILDIIDMSLSDNQLNNVRELFINMYNIEKKNYPNLALVA